MSTSKAQLWIGRAFSGLTVLGLLASAGMKLSAAPEIVKSWAEFGFPADTLTPIGVVEATIAIMTLIPRVNVLGLILVSAYLGGAVATHVHAGQPFLAPIILGVLAWGGLFLRDERIRKLIPLNQPE